MVLHLDRTVLLRAAAVHEGTPPVTHVAPEHWPINLLADCRLYPSPQPCRHSLSERLALDHFGLAEHPPWLAEGKDSCAQVLGLHTRLAP
jgi:hypothetical protein